MKSIVLAAAVLLAVAGCQARAKTPAVAAEAPKAIRQLVDQRVVYHCSRCQRDYDHPGLCPRDQVALEEMRVDYICPADGKPVEHAGRCPRCEVNATVVRTPLASNSESGGR